MKTLQCRCWVLIVVGASCYPGPASQDSLLGHAPYDVCPSRNEGEPCDAGPTTCRALPAWEHQCTMECETDDDCPARANALGVGCEMFTNGRVCVARCATADDCPIDTTCHEAERLNGEATSFCVAIISENWAE